MLQVESNVKVSLNLKNALSYEKLEMKNYFNFYFLLPISRISIIFGSNFRSGDFYGLTCFEVP